MYIYVYIYNTYFNIYIYTYQAHCTAGSPRAGKLRALRILGQPFASKWARSLPLKILVYGLPATRP